MSTSRALLVLALATVGSIAFAQEPPAPAVPAVSAPAAGSVQESVRESLRLIRDGKLDAWMDTWCQPIRCETQYQRDQLKQYGLARAQPDAARCLHGDDDAIVVSRIKGDPDTDDRVTVFIQCEPGRLPVPSTHVKVDGKWRVETFSW